MPRNGSGTYSLPVGPFTPGTVISSSDVNSDFSDIATALTGSLAADGQTQLTGQLKGSSGTTPPFSIAGDTNTGFGASAADQPYMMAGGTQVIVCTTAGASVTGTLTTSSALTVTTGGLTVTAGGLTVTAGGLTVSAGGAAITGNSTITGIFTVSSTSHEVLPNGTTLERPGSPAAAQYRFNSTLGWIEFYDGTVWRQPGRLGPTKTYLTSGSGNYTPPTNCSTIAIHMIGGGGGAGACTTNNGTVGIKTTFNGVDANPGGGGNHGGNGSNGGTGGTGGSGSADLRLKGSAGSSAGGNAGANNSGGTGGAGIFGSGAARGGQATAGDDGGTNTGAGGGGGGFTNANQGGGGGGAGEQVFLTIVSPTGPYAYSVGTGGAGGAAGTSAGGNGGAGIIIITEYY
jgi:hypothetical protein